jgi:hypothetical protein
MLLARTACPLFPAAAITPFPCPRSLPAATRAATRAVPPHPHQRCGKTASRCRRCPVLEPSPAWTATSSPRGPACSPARNESLPRMPQPWPAWTASPSRPCPAGLPHPGCPQRPKCRFWRVRRCTTTPMRCATHGCVARVVCVRLSGSCQVCVRLCGSCQVCVHLSGSCLVCVRLSVAVSVCSPVAWSTSPQDAHDPPHAAHAPHNVPARTTQHAAQRAPPPLPDEFEVPRLESTFPSSLPLSHSYLFSHHP